MNVLVIRLKTGKLMVRVSQVAAIENRDGVCWVYLNSGSGFETLDDVGTVFEQLKFCGWSTEEQERYEQWLHENG